MRARETRQFDFGKNWKAFSDNALTAVGTGEAKKDFKELVSGIELQNRSFLDIGFGQGLSLLTATAMGAKTLGCDINPLCADLLRQNQSRYFPGLCEQVIPVITGSILDEAVVDCLRRKSPNQYTQAYDIVHSWGVLHHTGEMKRAIVTAASLVAPGGYLIMAIYSRHWSSKLWKLIKHCYNYSPVTIQHLIVKILWPLIFFAKWLATGRNPLAQKRGMNFYYDVVDWAGGYPYEYATVEEIKTLVESLGFQLERVIPATVPTGCNQFVFRSGGLGNSY